MKKNILVVEDDMEFNEILVESLKVSGYEVSSFSDSVKAVDFFRENYGNISLVLSDIQMPNKDGFSVFEEIKSISSTVPFVFMTAYAKIEDSINMLKKGASDYLVKPFELSVLVSCVEANAKSHYDLGEVVIGDNLSKKLKEVAFKVAGSEVPVMLNGESGVGKEVWAKFIHDNSSYKDGPFVAINCAAISENMLEAVLFGYEKGAFTGAHKSLPGKFEMANGGTIFLDEITEMNIDLQSKLLRVIQEREVERLGSTKSINLDLRIISASNRDLKGAVRDGFLREDLFYRLNVFPIKISPLRERKGDIIEISNSIIAQRDPSVSLSTEAIEKLNGYNFPGNVRELINVLERAFVLKNGFIIEPSDIVFDDLDFQKNDNNSVKTLEDLKRIELELFFSAIEECSGNRQKAAEKLGVSKRTVQSRVKELKEMGYEV